MRNVQYLIYRRGSNTANQACSERLAVAIVEAASQKAALAAARVKCFANQWLEAVPLSRAPKGHVQAVLDDSWVERTGEEIVRILQDE